MLLLLSQQTGVSKELSGRAGLVVGPTHKDETASGEGESARAEDVIGHLLGSPQGLPPAPCSLPCAPPHMVTVSLREATFLLQGPSSLGWDEC